MRRFGFALAFGLTKRPPRRRPRSLRWARSMSADGFIEVTGQPVKEIVFTPGGVPAKIDPNGEYQVEQMYVQYFLPQNRKGKLPLLVWHGGGLTGVTYETKPDGSDGLAQLFHPQGLGRLHLRRDRARPLRLDRAPSRAMPCSCRSAIPGSASASDRPARGTTTRQAERLSRRPVPVRGVRQFMKQGVPRWPPPTTRSSPPISRWSTRSCPCVVMVHSQAGAFGFKVAEARPDQGQGADRRRAGGLAGDRQGRVDQGHAGPRDVRGTTPRTTRAGRDPQNGLAYAGVLKRAGGDASTSSICPTSASPATPTW